MTQYPILKSSVRIKKMQNFCWVMETLSGTDQAIAPIEAFLLASLTGEWDQASLGYLLENLFGLPAQEAREIVEGVLDRLSGCIFWRWEPSAVSLPYDPKTFLYAVSPDAIRTQTRLDTPSELTLSLTHACNFRCIYCFNASGQPARDELTAAEWQSVIRQGGELDVLKCTVTGGEPTLHPGFYEVLAEIQRQEMLLCLCTNGSVWNERLCSLLHGQTVQVSLDTAEASIHRRLTGRDNLPQVLAHIGAFAKAGIDVQVKCVLTPLNVESVAGLYAACCGLGVKKLMLDRFDVSSCGRGGTDLLISESDMQKVRELLQGIHAQDDMQVLAAFHPHRWEQEEDIVPCAAFRRSLILLPNGDVGACEKMADIPEMLIGNIRSQSLSQLWATEKIDAILHPPRDALDAACQTCPHLDHCGTGCYALKHYYGKGFFCADPRCRLRERSPR